MSRWVTAAESPAGFPVVSCLHAEGMTASSTRQIVCNTIILFIMAAKVSKKKKKDDGGTFFSLLFSVFDPKAVKMEKGDLPRGRLPRKLNKYSL